MEQSVIEYPRIILFGDSLTEKSFDSNAGLWGAMLADKFQRLADVISRGFSGYNSKMCRLVLPRLFTKENVANTCYFVIFLGANDASQSTQYVSLTDYEDNLKYMIAYLEGLGLSRDKMLLVTPSCYFNPAYVAYCKSSGREVPIRDNEIVAKYVEQCVSVGKQCSVNVVDIYTEMMKSEDWPKYLDDGLHFSRDGGVKVFNLLLPHIEKHVPKTMRIPDWKTVDLQNPETLLEQII